MWKGRVSLIFNAFVKKFKILECSHFVNSSLHAAAAFLNPSIFYKPNFKIDLRLRNGFQEAMLKMASTDKDKVEITKEHPIYINAQGALGTDFAIMGRTLNAPGM